MKTKSRNLIVVFLMVFAFVCGVFAITPLTANAAERDREIVAVDSGNSFNMRLSDEGVLKWDEVTGAAGYKVALLNSMGQTINEWDNTLTDSRVLQFVSEMDNSKYDSGRYTIEVIAKDTNKKASMSYYYTSNVDKLEEPHGLQWLGNQAVWEYVDGAIQYELFLYDFDGLVTSKSVTQCPVDLSEHNPQDGWTFAVQAETNGTLNDKRDSNIAESPKKGNGTRTVNLVDSHNALNMRITENEILMWDEVPGATGYQVVLKNPIGVEIYRWDNDLTNNARVLSIISEMDNLKIDSGHYRFEVEPKGAGSVAVISNYYYTSDVEQFEAPYNLRWNGSTATWTKVDGASSYDVMLYDFNGQVKTVTVTDDWYDFSEYNPQDGWTFKVQAEGDGRSTAKRSSNATESPAKTTSYDLTVVAYGTGNLPNTGKVSIETENDNQDFSTSVGGTYIKNTDVTVKAEANSGYEFVAWRVTAPENPEATLSTDATHTFKLENDLQLFAVFRVIPTEYTIVYDGNDASGYMADDVVSVGGTYTLKDCGYTTPYGKKFVGWAIGGADVTPLKQPGDEITINADTTIYAVWEELYFTTQPTNTSGKIGIDVELPVEIALTQVHNDDGYNIVLEVKSGENWEKVAEAKRSEWNSLNGGFTVQQNSACTKEYRYKIYNGTEWIESDTFTVEFLPIIVTFVDNDHSTTTEPIEVDTVGGKITKPENPTYSGDTFYGWNWPYWNFETDTVTQDITLYAQWAGRGYYGNIPNVYAKLGEKARIDLSNVYSNNSYTYVYRYDGANWIQVENVTNYGRYDLSASDVEKEEKYKIVISHSQNIESNEFTVTWTDALPTYDVYYSIGDGQGSVDPDYNANKEHGSTFTVSSYEEVGAIPLAGKQFDYWSIRTGSAIGAEIAQKQAGETITITADTYVVAIWKNAPTVMVSYYSVGNVIDSDIVAVGTQHTLMNAQGLDVPSGKQFKAWAIGGLGGEQKQPGDEITITEETYIYAVWEDITYTVSFNANGGSGSMLDETEQLGGYILPECTFTAPTGKQFKCWAEGSASGTQYNVDYEYDVTANVTFYAIWEDIPAVPTGLTASYSGTILAGNKIAINQLTVKLQYSDSSEMPCAGLCEYWYNGSKIDDPINYVFGVELIGTITITVKYQGFETTFDVQVVGYEITFNANTGSGTMGSVEYVGAYTLPACTFTEPDGKQFKGWSTSASGEVIDGATYNVTANVELFAIWEDIPVVKYDVTFNANGGTGTMSPVEYAGTYTLPTCAFTEPDGKQFKGWSTSASGEVIDGTTYNVTADVELFAIWEDIPHNHVFGDWEVNQTHHWKECACGEENEKAEHEDGDSDDLCDECGYDMTVEEESESESESEIESESENESESEIESESENESESQSSSQESASEVESSSQGGTTSESLSESQPQLEEPKDGLSGGAIAGIVVGSVAVAGVGGFALVWFVVKKKSFADLIAIFKKK